MKKWLSLIMVLAILLCVTACGAKPDASDKNNEDGTPKKAGEYNGQTITMSYTVTDVEYPSDMRSIAMQQGYAAFYDYTFKNSTTGTNTYSGDTWNFLDQNGNRVLSEPYTELESFNKNGVAVAQKMDGTYVQLNTKLEETPITEQEYLDFCLDANNTACNQTYPQGEGRYSCLEDGLAIYVEYVDGKAYAGLVDKNGTVIIKAYIPISYSEMVERLHLSEGVAFVEDAATSHIGMISVVRSSDASEGNGDTAMTDDEARNLCVTKMQQAYQIEVWYMSMDYPMGIDMLPAGTAVTYLDGTPYTLDHEYYRLADSLPEADRAVTTTAAALKRYLETVYTVDAIATEYYHSSAWVVYQGEVYRVAAEGMWHHRSLDTIRVTNKTADAITFTIDGLEDEPTEEHTLRYIDGNWKFDKLV